MPVRGKKVTHMMCHPSSFHGNSASRQFTDKIGKRPPPAASAQLERVVFIDETSVKAYLTRQRGWSQLSDRPVMDALFG